MFMGSDPCPHHIMASPRVMPQIKSRGQLVPCLACRRVNSSVYFERGSASLLRKKPRLARVHRIADPPVPIVPRSPTSDVASSRVGDNTGMRSQPLGREEGRLEPPTQIPEARSVPDTESTQSAMPIPAEKVTSAHVSGGPMKKMAPRPRRRELEKSFVLKHVESESPQPGVEAPKVPCEDVVGEKMPFEVDPSTKPISPNIRRLVRELQSLQAPQSGLGGC
ncbi:PREDICTED: uncharacterized protein LOC104589666 isoform X2 [Nelumbo nucifera]|uniref:Uncharacterized protein LOC104589666 isoform X2 n=1 Tax=Nelumbo nucifera TaxID=4432 RepID=A0A1U7Z2M9_NELNU|nr:PREDICTED: uncharacterized protein LOC104589666 isoform X2 [Nelumbo nucifera]